jgi:gluconate 2-dehydrogenase gamma chain
MQDALSRRRFVLSSATGISAAWVATHWPAILAAADHAHRAAQAASPPKLAVLTTEQATEIEAIASQIIPTDDGPGAREAGVIYFIDRALKTFASSQNGAVADGIAQVQEKTKELFPGVTKFSAASSEQQIAVLKAMENTPAFGLFRFHTVCGFLADPSRGGNRNEIGWKLIGFDSSHAFQPPFGYYDKDYPGWQPSGGDKK